MYQMTMLVSKKSQVVNGFKTRDDVALLVVVMFVGNISPTFNALNCLTADMVFILITVCVIVNKMRSETKFQLDPTILKSFPIDPIVNIARFSNVMSIDMTLQKWAVFIIGFYKEILYLSSDQAEILFLVI